jgi:hypothetical protein
MRVILRERSTYARHPEGAERPRDRSLATAVQPSGRLLRTAERQSRERQPRKDNNLTQRAQRTAEAHL